MNLKVINEKSSKYEVKKKNIFIINKITSVYCATKQISHLKHFLENVKYYHIFIENIS